MKYLLFAVLFIILVDLIRSTIIIIKAYKIFYKLHKNKKKQVEYTLGSGKSINVVIIGDSTFDVRADSKTQFGPAQYIVDKLALNRTVHVHLLAEAGAKTHEIIARQVPKLKSFEKVDLLIVYMGANNAVQFGLPGRIAKDYAKLMKVAEELKIPVAASEIACYWYLDIFSLLHRIWIYYAVTSANAKIREIFKTTKYAALAPAKNLHLELHKDRKNNPYLLDGFHPNDSTNYRFGENLYTTFMNHPKTKHILANMLRA